nr:hypothetical protein [Tanacetum cinerariifolium]
VSARSDSYNRRSHSWYTGALSESEDSEGGHWKSRSKKKKSSGEEDDLSQPWVCEETDPFTPQIRYFVFPKTRMPSHIKTYDRSEDPEDHLKNFQAAAKTEHSYDDLKKAFLENYLQQKKYIKDLIELHNIKQRDGEYTKDFVRRYKLESRDVKGAPECMRIFGFVHGITNPKLIKCLHDKIPKTVDEMMRVTTSFHRGKVAASNHERKKIFPPWKQHESSQKQNFKKEGFRNQQRSKRKQDRFSLLTKTPKEIFALDKGKFKALPPMTTPVEKQNHAKFCEFHGETFGKDKALAILRVQPWERVARQKITQSFSPNPEIFFPPFGEDDGAKGLMIIEAQIRGHCVHPHGMLKIPVEGGVITLKSSKLVPLECEMVFEPAETPSATKPIAEERVKVAINPEYPEQTPADMTGVPRHIAKHRLNLREGCSPIRQKKRGQAADRNQAIQEEVEKLVGAGIIREVHYHDWLSNLVMVKKHNGSWRMCVDIKDLNKACPKDGCPLPEIYWKVESLNVGATYQRLVDKAFHKQIGRNLEVYVDDLVIKSRTEDEIVRDVEETFKTLREINMKLNPKKCAFGVEEEMFLEYKVNAKGLKVCPDKVDVVLSLPSPKCLKDVQKLNGKLASLNRFLAKSAEKSLPFFKTLKKRTKKSDFNWTTKAEEAFKQMKHLIAKLPMLTAPMEKEELIVYLATAKETQAPKEVFSSTPNRSNNGPTHTVATIKTGSSRKATEMEYLIRRICNTFRPRISVKGQILADFIVKRPEEGSSNTPMEEEVKLSEPWILFTDGSSCTYGSGAELILTNPKGMEYTYALRFRFDSTNNKVEYEALIARLRTTKQMGVKNLQANVDSRLVANQVDETYVAKEADMIRYLEKVKPLAGSFKAFSIKQIPRSENKKVDALSKIASTSFAHLNNEKQFRDDPFKYWCEKLCIRQHFAFVKHLQTNGLVERANCSLGEGIKARLDARSKNWIEELPHVLWAHRTMIKSSNRDTSFSLTYRTEAVIPVEIGMPTLRTAKVDLIGNNEALEINLDLLEERREEIAIREAKSKARMEKIL